MCVSGSTSWVARHPHLGAPAALPRGTRLVIDVMAWLHQLYFEAIEWMLAGNPRQFQALLKRQLQEIAANKDVQVVAYVFDGARNHSGKQTTKGERDQRRMTSSMAAVQHLCGSGPFRLVNGKLHPSLELSHAVLPCSTLDVALTTMNAMELPVVVAADEADGVNAAIARRDGAMVVSRDSDFFIFDVPAGYVPIDSWSWAKDGDGVFRMRGTVYQPARLARHLGLPIALLPLFASLLGNDSVPRDNALASAIYSQSHGRLSPDARVSRLAQYLARFSYLGSAQKVLDAIAPLAGISVKGGKAASLYRSIQHSITQYTDVDKVDTFVDMPGNDLAVRISKLFATGALSTRLIDLFYYKVFETYTLLEDMTKDTAWDHSQPLRVPMYALWLDLRQRAGVSGVHDQDVVQENSRQEEEHVTVAVAVDMSVLEQLLKHSSKTRDVQQYGKRSLHQAFLKLHHANTVNLEPFKPHVQALILLMRFFVCTATGDPSADGMCPRTLLSLVFACLFPFTVPPGVHNFRPTRLSLHTIAQWQALLISSSLLAQSLFCLLPRLGMTHTDDGQPLSPAHAALQMTCTATNATHYDGPSFAFYYANLAAGGTARALSVDPKTAAPDGCAQQRIELVRNVLAAIGCAGIKC
ncbi:hypothetical protein RI367_002590 [Sorochytrium milnesiophthora]